MNVREQAGEALSRAGELLAAAETGIYDAVTVLNQAIDMACAAGMSPELARSLVTRDAILGAHGDIYLAAEIRDWYWIYDLDWQAAAAEIDRMHARQRPPEGSSTAGTADALTAAGLQLAQAEAAWETALERFEEAASFAVRAGVKSADVHSIVCARAVPRELGSAYLAVTVGTDQAIRPQSARKLMKETV